MSPHVAIGATIGAVLGNPLVVVPVAIASHYALDMVPHWQETLAPYLPTRATYTRVPIDLALAAGIIALQIHWHPAAVPAIFLGAVAANLPDIDSFLVFAPKLKRGLIKLHWDAHCAIQRETSSFWGLVPQVAVIFLGLYVSYSLRAL
jgi:hypothetical protein